jgi:hypothetical protein
MSTRVLLASLVVLALPALACAGFRIVLTNPTPTAEPVPTSTAEPLPTAIMPTEQAAAIQLATPTTGINHVPVIKSVDLRPVTTNGNMTVYQDISFEDAMGDVYFADYTLVSTTADKVTVEDGAVKIPADQQKSGAKFTSTWGCGDSSYEVTLDIILADKAGNKSDPYRYTIVCGLGAVATGFPDPFDDNRNGWELDDVTSIKGGVLQFRKIQATEADWLVCAACTVTPKENFVSVEGWWSNTVDSSLGLLIDYDTCTPDGLVFMIGPTGYYAIFQSVRDASGKWSYWRPLIDWAKSSLIRKAQNAKNLIAVSYEFGDELHVTFYLNGSRVTGAKVYGYNGSKECRPGLYASGGLDANFDNFSISPPSP